MVNLIFSWGFIEILRYKQTARIKPLTENCACTFDTAHHGSDQSKPHSIGFFKKKIGVHTLSLPSISMFKLTTFTSKCVIRESSTARENLNFQVQRIFSFFMSRPKSNQNS